MKTSPCARWSRFRTPKMSVYPIATREYAPPSISPLTSCWTNIVRDHTPGLTAFGPPYYRRPTMPVLRKIRIFPTGMRLHEWIAFAEGFSLEPGLDPEVMCDVYLGQMRAWTADAGLGPRPRKR